MQIDALTIQFSEWDRPEDSIGAVMGVMCGTTRAEVSLCVYKAHPDDAQINIEFTVPGSNRSHALIKQEGDRLRPGYASALHVLASQLKAVNTR